MPETTTHKHLSFDAWNQITTSKIIKDNPGMSRQIRTARTGGLARLILWDDYLKDAEVHGFQPEPKPFA